MLRWTVPLALFACLTLPHPARAWSRPAHMVTAAIAYADLKAADPARLAVLVDLLDAHPDRSAFEVAIDRTTGEERARRMFYECARWPDDTRGTVYDHPTWHYAARAVRTVGAGQSDTPPDTSADATTGSAIEAFALNLHVLNDTNATKPERAVALCWVMHLVGDIHQPLHTAQLVSDRFPGGDALGSKQFVREHADEAPVTLHWLWDDSVHRSGTPDSVEARARDLVARYAPPTAAPKTTTTTQFQSWARDESYPLARTSVYAPDLTSAPDPSSAPVIGDAYRQRMIATTEHRVRTAGARLGDVLR